MSIRAEKIRIRGELLTKRQLLRELKRRVIEARRARAKRLSACRLECSRNRREARKRAALIRQKVAEHLRAFRTNAKKVCHGCAEVRAQSDAEIRSALEHVQKESAELKKLRMTLSGLRSSRGQAGGRRAAELRAESDDQVKRDLGDDAALIQLWQKVKHKIKGSPKISRTEAFFKYVHDHSEALDELRSQNERAYEDQIEKMYRNRANMTTEEQLEESNAKILELSAALQRCETRGGDVPF